jgi:hypothetical protein
MSKPHSISIGGVEVEIVYIPKLNELADCWGEFSEEDGRKLVIRIDDGLVGQDLLSTLFHEMCHASLHISGLAFAVKPDMEEAIVRCIELIYNPAVKQLATLLQEKSNGKSKGKQRQ